MGWLLIALAALAFSGVTWFAWTGALGLKAIVLLLVAAVCFSYGRGTVPKALRSSYDMAAKVVFTFVGIMALLRHPITVEGQGSLPIYEAILQYVDQVDTTTFILFACIAMAVKFVGVISSAFAWYLLLRGQGIVYPFWSKVMTSFLIGRFIGTFLPSTIGLDGYTLYEAGRYSNEWPRALTAKALEKFVGITGLFLGMIVTMPFGYQVIVDVTDQAGKPEAAPMVAGLILLVAGGISSVVIIGLLWPVLLVKSLELFTRLTAVVAPKIPVIGKLSDRVVSILTQFTDAVGAYHGKVGLLMLALAAKFVTHFTTFAVYYFTALAIGVVSAEFWPIVFGSSIQVLATVFSPTIAGEGAREAVQALLLSNQLGGVAQAVLSGALGFIAAEAATMWGGVFLWTRTPEWRPAYVLVDGKQVDFAWLSDEDADDTGFSAEKLAAIRAANS